MVGNLNIKYLKNNSWVSVILGIISLIPFLGVIILSEFFWTISLDSNFIMYSFYTGGLSGIIGLISGIKNFKVRKKIAIVGIIFSGIGIIISMYYILFSVYLARF